MDVNPSSFSSSSSLPYPSPPPLPQTICYTDAPDSDLYIVWETTTDMDSNAGFPVTPPKQDSTTIVPWTTPDKGSPPQLRYYSGVAAIFDGAGHLSRFHCLDSHGALEYQPSEVDELCNQDQGDGQVTLTNLMKPGLAAVVVEVKASAQGPGSRQSGFRLRRDGVDVVVTCAHFLDWPDNQAAFDDLARKFSTKTNGVHAVQVGDAGSTVHDYHNKLKLQLIAVHRPWDIAIFRVTELPKSDGNNTVIDWSQIHFATQEDRGTLGAKDLWWSVGYNQNNNQTRFHSDWSEFFLRQPKSAQQDIQNRYSFDETKPPSLDFLKTNRRTVSFGKLDESAATGFPPQPYQVSLNLSAWYGRSGSMVCAREDDVVGGQDSRVCVYGLIMGGNSASNYNVMTLFTEEMRDWFEKGLAFSKESEDHPVGFEERFVMAIGDGDEDTI